MNPPISKSIPIFLSSDNNYAPFVATTIASICNNTSSLCNFYILDGGISSENRNKIIALKSLFRNLSIEFIKIDINNIFKDVIAKSYITLSAFNRLLIPQLVPKITKAIYLDVDIIAFGDIKTLYQEDLQDYIIGAVPDQGAPELLAYTKKQIDINEKSIYFNSGVLLIDCPKWRKNVHIDELLSIEKKYREKRLHNDQDVLNKFFENNYKILDYRYNVMFDAQNIVLRHYTSQIKPWQADFYLDAVSHKPLKTKNIETFWQYAKMTEFYNELVINKEHFLSSNILYKRFNKIVQEDKNL